MKLIPPMPETLEALEAQRADLVARKQAIELQLLNKNATDEDGRRIPSHEYHDWRFRAVAAVTAINKRLSALKVRKRDLLRKNYAALGAPQSNDPAVHLAAAYALLRKLQRDGVDFDDQERAIVDSIRMFLDTGAAAESSP